MGRILTMADVHEVADAEGCRAWLARFPAVRRLLLAQDLAEVPAVDVDLAAAPAIAYVNHSQWVADCPTRTCGGAMLLNHGMAFLCGRCLNADIGHRWRPVRWPLDREAVEVALTAQPLTALRNWSPAISVPMLLEQVGAELRGETPRRLRELEAAAPAWDDETARVTAISEPATVGIEPVG